MNIFSRISLIFTWLPFVVSAVSVVEAMFNPATPGADKKAAALAYLSTVAEKIGLPWGDAAVEVISNLIDTVVTIANFIGRFVKGADASPEDVEVLNSPAVKGAAPPIEIARKNVAERVAKDPVLDAFMKQTAK